MRRLEEAKDCIACVRGCGKHLPDKQALEAGIISVGFELQAETFELALRDADGPLVVLASTYRWFAKTHPHLYRLMTQRELNRDRLAPGVESRAGRPIFDAAATTSIWRAAWAFAHGMTILELGRRFPPDADLEAAWRRGIEAFRPRPTRRGALQKSRSTPPRTAPKPG